MFKKNSKTEKFLIGSISVLAFILVFSVFSKDPIGALRVSASSEESGSEMSSESEESEESEKSEESEGSEISEKSLEAVRPATATNTQQEISENSMASEMSELSEVSEVSEISEQSVQSVKSVEGYDETVVVEGDKAIVKKKEKFLGIFETEVESEVTLDNAGNVIDEKKNFFNWLRSVFSF